MKHLFYLLFISTFASGQSYDLVIKNGRVVDGTGNPWYYADVAIQNGKVARIGPIPATDGKTVIDAKNQIVAPGFIDVHTHVEGSLQERPGAENFIYDGVTTLVTGNCGASATNLRLFYDSLRISGFSPNVASMIGHNTVRMKVMKMAFREPTAKEQTEMETLVEQAMKDGAVGISTGLIYTPGTYARTPEIVNLAKMASRYGGVYASHMRNEGQDVKKAIEEAIQIGREANIPVEISHFKVASKPIWGSSTETVAMVEAARREGYDVTVDQYPYTASSTSLASIVPSWALADGDSATLLRFRDPATRAKIRKEMLDGLRQNARKNYDYAVVAFYPADTTFNGLSITKINQKLGRKNNAETEADLVMELMDKTALKRIQMVYHTMSEEDVATIMRYPNTMIASDAGVANFQSGMPHPRGYGTNARVLGVYVRDKKVIPVEEAIRRMSSLPAQRFKLDDRGILKPGYAADLVIFDEKTVADRSTYDQPHAYSSGFSYVLVNGVPVIESGKHTGKRPGQILMGKGYAGKAE
ncbi:N-acyl-D-amino-acid deacylase family protein [Larkinella terrae]|uniref:Amidohydrolase family protein n=1 Tax=Larkinella terrae TaxID=2025311 RepID=A0A7K0EFJ1_9BACT|nr:D-aminoacylase [Larkinella terrae]MRS60610.1 amidohydrolase family protein [Larkinella terrae]